MSECYDIYKVAILNPGAGLGDHIMTLPAFNALKSEFKDSEIVLVSNTKTASIRQLLPDLAAFISLDTASSLLLLCKLFRLFWYKKFDAVLYLGKSPIIPILLWLSGVSVRVGYDTQRFSSLFLTKKVALSHDDYMGIQHLRLAECLFQNRVEKTNTTYSFLPDVPTSNLESARIEHLAFVNQLAPKVVIHPGFSQASQKRRYLKSWPVKYWQDLILNLLSKYPSADLILLGGPDDEAILAELALFSQTLPSEYQSRIYDLAGLTPNLSQLAWVISQAAVLISVDSFPMHLGIGLKVPTVAIFASTNEKNYIPEMPFTRSVVCSDISCRPCLWTYRSESCQSPICLQVPVSEVVHAIEALMLPSLSI